MSGPELTMPKPRYCRCHCSPRKLVVLAAVCVLMCGCFIFRKDVATWYVARQLRIASTPAMELHACERMNRWAYVWSYAYGVEAEDASEIPLRPWETGQYDKVAEVVITWENGTSVRRKILNRTSLEYVFGN
jgi:hypothetical protein